METYKGECRVLEKNPKVYTFLIARKADHEGNTRPSDIIVPIIYR
jgi:hypothetical protein